jgi:hypothetical protein
MNYLGLKNDLKKNNISYKFWWLGIFLLSLFVNLIQLFFHVQRHHIIGHHNMTDAEILFYYTFGVVFSFSPIVLLGLFIQFY